MAETRVPPAGPREAAGVGHPGNAAGAEDASAKAPLVVPLGPVRAVEGLARGPRPVPDPPATETSKPGVSSVDLRPTDGQRVRGDELFLLGDSQCEGVSRRLRAMGSTAVGLAQLERVGANPMPGQGIAAVRAWVASQAGAELLRRRLLLLQVGGNDLSSGRTASQVIDELKMLLNDLHVRNGALRVVVGTIPPRWSALVRERSPEVATAMQARLDEVNAWITRGDPDVSFAVLRTEPIVGARTRDGHWDQRPDLQRQPVDVHLNDRGYDLLAAAFVRQWGR